MFRISAFLMFMFFAIISYGQSEGIVVKNIVEFYEYTDDKQETQDAVNFILEVTNHSDHPIPDLGATSPSEYVNLYINGKRNNPLSLLYTMGQNWQTAKKPFRLIQHSVLIPGNGYLRLIAVCVRDTGMNLPCSGNIMA
ncbi:MAG: hypothetical protein ACP5DZ_05095 [Bacteroidales bacterium]